MIKIFNWKIFTSNVNKSKFPKPTQLKIENYNEDLDENVETTGNTNHLLPKWESNKNNLNEITKGKTINYFLFGK